MLEPVLSAEALLKEALLATLKPTRTRFDMWEPASAAALRRFKASQAARLKPHA